jgi:hypothetical protein
MRKCLVFGVIAFLAAALASASPAAAGVVVLDNHTSVKVDFIVQPTGGTASRHILVPGDVLPIPATDAVDISYSDGQPHRYVVRPNSIYYFVNHEKSIELAELMSVPCAAAAPAPVRPPMPGKPAPPAAAAAPPDICTIPVMILADDQEQRLRQVWEKKIRARLAAASDIFEHHCRVRLQVVAVGDWVSEDKTFVFEKSLEEFERKVNPAPARLAIGFTSRLQWLPGEKHAGCTRMPLHPYILIREAFQRLSEAERLEFLVHEVGHYLGSVHTPDNSSVMRPTLGDGRSNARSFRIGFDAPNTLIMYLIAEELRTRPIVSLIQLSPNTKAALRVAYSLMAQSTPHDPGAQKDMQLLGVSAVIFQPRPSIVPTPTRDR